MDLRERIVEAARELGEHATIKGICQRSGVSKYQLYKIFPGGLDEVLRALREPKREPGEEPHAKAFRLLERGGSPVDLVAGLGLKPEDAEHLYRSYLELKGVDIGSMREEIERLKLSKIELQRKVFELEDKLEKAVSESLSAYNRGYSDGYGEGYREGARKKAGEYCDFTFWLLRRLHPGLPDYEVASILQNYLEIYRLEKLKEEVKTASGTPD